MREIKIRVFKAGEIDYNPEIIYSEFQDINEQLAGYDENGYTVMQCAGLKDVNGKEVYEGDIVRRHFEYPEEKPVIIEEICDIHKYELDSSKCEVVGNIYENKDLF